MRGRCVVGALGIALLLTSAGCARGVAGGDPQAGFRSLVASADASFASGDASRAWELYRQALETTGATDPDGAIARRAEGAKTLTLARTLVVKDTTAYDLSPFVQVLSVYAVGTTETAEAQRKTVRLLDETRRSMMQDVGDARLHLDAREEPERSPAGMMASTSGDIWLRDLEPVPGPLGEHLRAATKLLSEAGTALEEAWTANDERGARAALDASAKALQKAAAELKAAGASRPQLRT